MAKIFWSCCFCFPFRMTLHEIREEKNSEYGNEAKQFGFISKFKITLIILRSKNHVQICDGQHKWQVSY